MTAHRRGIAPGFVALLLLFLPNCGGADSTESDVSTITGLSVPIAAPPKAMSLEQEFSSPGRVFFSSSVPADLEALQELHSSYRANMQELGWTLLKADAPRSNPLLPGTFGSFSEWERNGQRTAILSVAGNAGIAMHIFLCPPEPIARCQG